MGGQGSGRRPSIKTLVQRNSAIARNTNVGNGNFILPNHSGDHSKGIVRQTPTQDTDIVNKQYVDENAGKWEAADATTLQPKAPFVNATITGDMTANTYYGDGSNLTGIAQYWTKSGTDLSPTTAGDDISMPDGDLIYFGNSKEASITYVGGDLEINPKESGAGKTINKGDLQTNGDINAVGDVWLVRPAGDPFLMP